MSEPQSLEPIVCVFSEPNLQERYTDIAKAAVLLKQQKISVRTDIDFQQLVYLLGIDAEERVKFLRIVLDRTLKAIETKAPGVAITINNNVVKRARTPEAGKEKAES